MGKKKNKIPKGKDIEDIVFKEDYESIKTMEDVVKTIKIKTKREQFTESIRKGIDKKVENYCKRKEIQEAEEKKQLELLKVIEKNRREEENCL